MLNELDTNVLMTKQMILEPHPHAHADSHTQAMQPWKIVILLVASPNWNLFRTQFGSMVTFGPAGFEIYIIIMAEREEVAKLIRSKSCICPNFELYLSRLRNQFV